jgi:tetratricopeptide (TPR) repeat protein
LDEAPNAALAERDYRAAQSLINSDQYDRAVSALEALVGAYPDHAGAHNDLGVLYAQVGDLARGIKHLEIALSISPGDRNARQNLDDIRKALKMCA